MRTLSLIIALGITALLAGLAHAAQTTTDDVIALERAALDRWGAGDPQGFLET